MVGWLLGVWVLLALELLCGLLSCRNGGCDGPGCFFFREFEVVVHHCQDRRVGVFPVLECYLRGEGVDVVIDDGDIASLGTEGKFDARDLIRHVYHLDGIETAVVHRVPVIQEVAEALVGVEGHLLLLALVGWLVEEHRGRVELVILPEDGCGDRGEIGEIISVPFVVHAYHGEGTDGGNVLPCHILVVGIRTFRAVCRGSDLFFCVSCCGFFSTKGPGGHENGETHGHEKKSHEKRKERFLRLVWRWSVHGIPLKKVKLERVVCFG